MLLALGMSVLAATPTVEDRPVPALLLTATGLSDVTLLEVGPTGGRLGVGVGGRVGLLLGLTERLHLGPSLDVRHDFASGRTDVFGAARLSTRFEGVFAISMGLGYGLGSFSAPVPQHLLVIGTGVALRGGRFWFSLETEVIFRVVVTGSRTIRVIGAITFEHDLLG